MAMNLCGPHLEHGIKVEATHSVGDYPETTHMCRACFSGKAITKEQQTADQQRGADIGREYYERHREKILARVAKRYERRSA